MPYEAKIFTIWPFREKVCVPQSRVHTEIYKSTGASDRRGRGINPIKNEQIIQTGKVHTHPKIFNKYYKKKLNLTGN